MGDARKSSELIAAVGCALFELQTLKTEVLRRVEASEVAVQAVRVEANLQLEAMKSRGAAVDQAAERCVVELQQSIEGLRDDVGRRVSAAVEATEMRTAAAIHAANKQVVAMEQALTQLRVELQQARDEIHSTRFRSGTPLPPTLRELQERLAALREIKASGAFDITAVKAAGYSLPELKAVGYDLPELKLVGYSIQDARAAGYIHGLHAAGYTLSEVKAAGYSCLEALSAGYFGGVKAVGYTCAEAKSAGYTVGQLKAEMFTPRECIDSGFSLDEVLALGICLSGSRSGDPMKIDERMIREMQRESTFRGDPTKIFDMLNWF